MNKKYMCSKMFKGSRCIAMLWSSMTQAQLRGSWSSVQPGTSTPIQAGNTQETANYLLVGWSMYPKEGLRMLPTFNIIQWCAYWVLILSMSNSLELPSSALSEWQLKSDLSKPMGIIKSKVLSAHRLQPAKWSQRDSWFPYTVITKVQWFMSTA